MINSNQKGIGLIEVLMAMFILAIAFSSIHIMQVNNQRSLNYLEMRDFARVSALQVIDELHLLGALSINDSLRIVTDTLYTTGSGATIVKSTTVSWSVTVTDSINGRVSNKNILVISTWKGKSRNHQISFPIVVKAL